MIVNAKLTAVFVFCFYFYFYFVIMVYNQCFDIVGSAIGRASWLWKYQFYISRAYLAFFM